MSEISDYLSINKCNCHLSWCDYFGGNLGDKGMSFTKDEIVEMLEDAKQLVKHLESIISSE